MQIGDLRVRQETVTREWEETKATNLGVNAGFRFRHTLFFSNIWTCPYTVNAPVYRVARRTPSRSTVLFWRGPYS
jgi:hypothetical protein